MCHDPEPDEPPEDEAPETSDDESESLDEMLAKGVREHFMSIPFETEDHRPDGAPPTPGELVLYRLGQLYRLWRRGELTVEPSAFDVEEVVHIVGVSADLEFVTEDRHGRHFHFANQVLHSNRFEPFPWRLLNVWEWAAEQELNDFERQDWD